MEKISEWIKGDSEVCRPCFLPTLVNWFVWRLETTGRKEIAEKLKNVALNEPPEEVASLMDNIMEDVCKQDSETCSYLKEVTSIMMEAEKETT